MLIDQENMVLPGMVIFVARNKTTIESFLVLKDPAPPSSPFVVGLFVEVEQVPISYNGQDFHYLIYNATTNTWSGHGPFHTFPNRSISLCDAGINQPTPRYNNHAMFDDLDEAKKYNEGLFVTSTATSTTSQTSPETHESAYERAMRGI